MGKIADISKYQGDVDWAKVREELDFCILRASCGMNPDVKFALNAAACTRYGIPFHAYHYIKALDSDQATAEAQVFHDAVKDTKVLFLVLDCEYKEITALETRNRGSAALIVDAFVEKLKTLGWPMNRIAIYIGHNVYTTWALDYPDYAYTWIPRYGKNDGNIPGDEYKPKYLCDLWQYTSEGTLPGVEGDVDLNMLMGTKPLSFFTTLPAAEEAPEENDEGSVNPMFTNLQLAAYCLAVYAAKWVYWYGSCGYECTTSLFNRKKKQYASHYTSSRESGYKADIAAGKMCADCVGLIKSFFWKGGDLNGDNKYKANNCPDRSANGLFGVCEETGDIKTIPEIPGLVVWRSGHIGVYVGNGMTVEMKGFSYDCVHQKVTSGSWTKWGKLPASMLAYVDGDATIPEPVTYMLGDRIPLEKGDEGNDVAELQAMLKSMGYCLGDFGPDKDGVDGDFGSMTVAALKNFQEDRGLTVSGIMDNATYKALVDGAETEQPDPDEDTPEDGSAPAYVLIVEGDEATLRKAQAEYGGTLAAVDSVTVKN